tara:strand:+ start:356 stop:1213 length:858 start_codon:yes stop_codon:yes gene_type:complete
MQIYRTIAELQQALFTARQQNFSVALVPTMGNLHEGHLALVKQAKTDCDFVITSIFVNPTQFGPNEDLNAYPRTFDEDISALQGLACDAVFAPEVDEIYPDGLKLETRVSVPSLARLLCGTSRPGHFDGVCAVVSKLFNLCSPDKAYFGEKDYQQLCIIRRLVRDLNFPLEIISVQTHREASGLAMSSRNNYLSEDQKQQAAVIFRTLEQSAETLREIQMPDLRSLEEIALGKIQAAGLRPEYFAICNPDTLQPAHSVDLHFRLLTAARLGQTRLIDNIGVNISK